MPVPMPRIRLWSTSGKTDPGTPAPGQNAEAQTDLEDWILSVISHQVDAALKDHATRLDMELQAVRQEAVQARSSIQGVAAKAVADIKAIAGQVRTDTDGLAGQVQADISTLGDTEERRIRELADAAVGATERRFEEHERILDAIRARWVDDNPDLTPQDFLARYNFAEVLKSLFTQRLRKLTNPRIREERSQRPSVDALLREAELVRDMGRALFGSGSPDFDALAALVTDGGRLQLSADDSRLLARVQRDVTQLINSIRETRHKIAFTFDVPPGSPADPDQYDLWTSSIPGRPVAFVVTPGYEAAGRHIRRPAVITTERLTGQG